jgi:CAAX protease family protein
MTILGLDPFTWILIVLLLGISPWLGRSEIGALRQALARGEKGARLRVYRKTIIMEWGVSVVLLGLWLSLGRGWSDVGLVPRAVGWQWLAIAASMVATVILVWQSLRAAGNSDQLQKLRDELGCLEDFVPHNDAELRRFQWLSVTAGICEEILYRGLLLGALSSAVGLWPAALLSSVIFGFGHSYQGVGGILRTAAVGFVLALVVVFSGSLFVAMLAHAVLDIAQGRLLHAAVQEQGAEAQLEAFS